MEFQGEGEGSIFEEGRFVRTTGALPTVIVKEIASALKRRDPERRANARPDFPLRRANAKDGAQNAKLDDGRLLHK